MRLFVTHMHGFTPKTWPVVSFRSEKTAVDLARRFGSKDFVIYVGSKAVESGDQGKILGSAKLLDRTVVRTEPLIKADAGCYKDGEFRWPFGIKIKQAWLVTSPRPDAKPIIGEKFSHAPYSGFYIIEDQETVSAILNLNYVEVPM